MKVVSEFLWKEGRSGDQGSIAIERSTAFNSILASIPLSSPVKYLLTYNE